MATKTSTWQCSGTADNPHDPFDNFGPDCIVCGAKKEDIIGSKRTSKSPPNLPIKPIAGAIAGGVLLLGVGWFISPNIPGLCNITQNCQTWKTDLAQAKSKINEAETIANKKDAFSKQELEDGLKKINDANKLLLPLRQQNSLTKEVNQLVSAAQKAEKSLRKLITATTSKDQAKSKINDAEKIASKKDSPSKQELENGLEKIDDAIKLLDSLKKQNLLAKEINQLVSTAQKTKESLGAKITSKDPVIVRTSGNETYTEGPVVTDGTYTEEPVATGGTYTEGPVVTGRTYTEGPVGTGRTYTEGPNENLLDIDTQPKAPLRTEEVMPP